MDSLSIPSAIPSPSILSPKRKRAGSRSRLRQHRPRPLLQESELPLPPLQRFGDGFGIERGGRERLGPPAPGPGSDSGDRPVSTFPWSLFTKSPRRRMRVAFTCNVCGQRTTRAINPHAYTDGTVFVQCCGCNVFHKLVDNLNLFHEMKCYVSPSFPYKGNLRFNFLDGDDDDNDENIFPIL
ncbi:uncharacterized protein LOC109839057 [Asparagus officinalis]|uniref:uncharacterized protein LOC109839057 n=1 Tax=Asparagus officinalis TaxID=4686 RepID=UPI00098E0AE6|nr:uncharacterized protein LOC109839057 [Asparagus officinalis]